MNPSLKMEFDLWRAYSSLTQIPVPVQIVQLEGPAQFLLQGATAGYGEGTNKLGKLDGSILCKIGSNEQVEEQVAGLTLFSSNTLNTKLANSEGSPWGKNCL